VNGGYSISYYTQGALIGHLLELHLRDATEMRRGMDDVARLLYERYAGARGFTGEDLLHAVNEVCECDLQPFFERHVSGATPPDFDRYLGLLGWRLAVERGAARGETGEALPDLRVSLLGFAGVGSAGGAVGGRPRLSVPDPTGAWGAAGLQTGDELMAVNGKPVRRSEELGVALAGAKVGDQLRVEFARGGVPRTATVTLTPYETTSVRIVELPRVTERQQRMRRRWLLGGR
jgi:predicted metalloprotease with PDZ domain